MEHTQPFGLWPSPITARSLAGSLRLNDVQWDSDGQTLVWHEGRSAQGVLVALQPASGEAPRDLTVDLSVRAKVGYGGGDFTVSQGTVFFAEAASGRIYRQALAGGPARPVTPAFGAAAAPTLSPTGRWLLYVHSVDGVDCLAIADAEGKQWPQRLVSGHDFYMQPVWHPNGSQIAFVAWNHPNMPWDGTTLYLASLAENGAALSVTEQVELAGGSEIAIFQPAFSPDGRYLAYVSDATGWGQLYVYEFASKEHRQLTHGEAEHGEPAWGQGQRMFGWASDGQSLFVLRNERGIARLYRQPVAGGDAQPVEGLAGYDWLEAPAINPHQASIALVASSGSQPTRLLLVEQGASRVLRRTTTETVEPGKLSSTRPVSWDSPAGIIHGMLNLPPGYEPAEGTPLPPAIIAIHGGPTSQRVASYSGQAQFFATRGYTFLEVNYRGSTGYGRPYMLALRGNWGICDVEDAVSGAQFLASSGYADPARIVIVGGSAGGYTVLEAMCRAPGVFRAGLCLYGVANMFTLAADTHKFEERYLDSLLGPLPEAAAIYRERSPIFHAELLRDPLAVFQGSDDTVVPQAQSDSIVESLRRRNIPHEYHIYQGEGHGWRKAETIEAFYKSVEAFLRQYVIFS
jgi:dipeptidyl aminopeptidase/acylaminoacyl peptidase